MFSNGWWFQILGTCNEHICSWWFRCPLCKGMKIIVVHNEQEFSLSTFVSHFKFPNLFLLFLLILKRCQKVFKTFLCCFNAWYEMFATTLQQLWFQWADQSMTFSISSVKSHRQHGQSAGYHWQPAAMRCILNPGLLLVLSCKVQKNHWFIFLSTSGSLFR